MRHGGERGRAVKEALLRVENVSIGYTHDIVRQVSFEVAEKSVLAIVGESGSGKSTLLKSLIGPYPGAGSVRRGKILYRGKDLVTMRRAALSAIRGREISLVFQSPGATLNPVRKIGSQFAETICYHTNLTRREAREKAAAILQKLNMRETERVLDGYAFELSGGMKQRVSIAMALALEPKLLLADEPTSALDATVQKAVVEELLALHREMGTAIVIVTHNMMLSAYMADRIAVMYAGEIVEIGAEAEVMDAPQHPYTQALIASIPRLDEEKELKGIDGRRIDLAVLPPGCIFANRCDRAVEICSMRSPRLQAVGADHHVACHLCGKEDVRDVRQ